MSKVIGIISLKGGVGKTSCVTNLASVLHDFNKKILIIDANLSAPNLGIHLGLIDPENTLHDVLNGDSKVEEAIHSYDKFDLIPASLGSNKINPLELKKHVDLIKKNYDLVLIDSSPSLNSENLAVLLASDEILLVTTPDYASLSTTMKMFKQAKTHNLIITGLIINKALGKKYELSIHDIEQAINLPVMGVLPHDDRILQSIALSTPLVDFKPNSKIANSFRAIAATLIGQDYAEKENFLDKIKSFFKKSDIRKDKVNRLLKNRENVEK